MACTSDAKRRPSFYQRFEKSSTKASSSSFGTLGIWVRERKESLACSAEFRPGSLIAALGIFHFSRNNESGKKRTNQRKFARIYSCRIWAIPAPLKTSSHLYIVANRCQTNKPFARIWGTGKRFWAAEQFRSVRFPTKSIQAIIIPHDPRAKQRSTLKG